MSPAVRTRIAPSPTGDPHVGTAYMGLVNMIYARQHGGQFLLRIDDTDRTRFRAGSEDAIFQSLRWLGLEWDEGPDKGGPCGPYRQSERTEIYQQHARRLVEAGRAYRCFCTPARLDALRAEQKQRKEITRYDGLCRRLAPEEAARRAAAGEPQVVRLAMPQSGSVVVQDLLRGPIELKEDNFQDQVLLKQDGFPTYHLASVVDDHLFSISHIIRAEEWISSAPIHKVLFEAFGWEMPVLCHMPLLRNQDKSKISKRKNPTSILHYREAGFLPAALLNFLGLMGWGGPKGPEGAGREVFSLEDMQAHFRLEDLTLGGPVFDLDKLRHLNSLYLRALAPAEFARVAREFLLPPGRLEALAPLVQPRVQTLGEVISVVDLYLGDVSHFTPETRKAKDPNQRQLVEGLVPEGREREEAWFALAEVQERLERAAAFTAAELEVACRELAAPERTGWQQKELFMTLRVALTGRRETPPLFESFEVLGRARALGRLSDAQRALGEPSKKAQERWRKARAAKGAAEAAEA